MNKIVVLVAVLLFIATTTVNAFVPMSTLFGTANQQQQQQQHDALLTESFATVLSDEDNSQLSKSHPWDNPDWFDLMVTNTHISQPAYRIVSGNNNNHPIDQIKVEILEESEVSFFLPQGRLSVLWNLLANSYYGVIDNEDVTVSSNESTFIFKSTRRFVPLQMTVQPNFTFRLKNGNPAQNGSHVAVRFSTFLGEKLVATWDFKYNIGDATLPLSSNGLVPYSRLGVEVSKTQRILNTVSALITFVIYILVIVTLVCAYRAQFAGSWIQNPLFMKPIPKHFQPENSVYTPKQH